jgi:hypothetical protein
LQGGRVGRVELRAHDHLVHHNHHLVVVVVVVVVVVIVVVVIVVVVAIVVAVVVVAVVTTIVAGHLFQPHQFGHNIRAERGPLLVIRFGGVAFACAAGDAPRSSSGGLGIGRMELRRRLAVEAAAHGSTIEGKSGDFAREVGGGGPRGLVGAEPGRNLALRIVAVEGRLGSRRRRVRFPVVGEIDRDRRRFAVGGVKMERLLRARRWITTALLAAVTMDLLGRDFSSQLREQSE